MNIVSDLLIERYEAVAILAANESAVFILKLRCQK